LLRSQFHCDRCIFIGIFLQSRINAFHAKDEKFHQRVRKRYRQKGDIQSPVDITLRCYRQLQREVHSLARSFLEPLHRAGSAMWTARPTTRTAFTRLKILDHALDSAAAR